MLNIYVGVRNSGVFATAHRDCGIGEAEMKTFQGLVDTWLPPMKPGTYSLSDAAVTILAHHGNSDAAKEAAADLLALDDRYQALYSGEPALAFAYHEHPDGVPANVYVCGDIHGQYDELMEALKAVNFDRQKDILYCTGDLVDRGKDSFKCLSLVFEPWFRACLGNHEVLAWDALREGVGASYEWDLWQSNGGSWVYLEDAYEVRSILGEALNHLPLAREITFKGRRIGLCHAEPPATWQLVRDDALAHKERLTWGRSRYREAISSLSRPSTLAPIEGIDAVIVGHTIVDKPRWITNMLYIDTGAFTADGTLTLMPLEEVVAQAPSVS